ncbi:hypothetical protein OG426_35900 [Streptomyces canus]|uniref:hypothetical protein n=1 Tax=Streptomyces canus TaxID=58343 RepID=UPI003867EF4D|nr:hypothetical protein OG426_35900 [Streptomyces canus]
MNEREEGQEDDTTGWAWEYDPSAEWVVGAMKAMDREAVTVIASAPADLASSGLDPDGRLDEDPNPMRLRTYSTGTILVWYQVVPYRKRVYVKRVNL